MKTNSNMYTVNINKTRVTKTYTENLYSGFFVIPCNIATLWIET